jgi:hypothetical protein
MFSHKATRTTRDKDDDREAQGLGPARNAMGMSHGPGGLRGQSDNDPHTQLPSNPMCITAWILCKTTSLSAGVWRLCNQPLTTDGIGTTLLLFILWSRT